MVSRRPRVVGPLREHGNCAARVARHEGVKSVAYGRSQAWGEAKKNIGVAGLCFVACFTDATSLGVLLVNSLLANSAAAPAAVGLVWVKWVLFGV